VTRLRISNDILTVSYQVAYRTVEDMSKSYRDERVKQQALALADDVEFLPLIIDLFFNEELNNADFSSVRKRAFKIISKARLLIVRQKLADIKPDKTIFQWEYIDKNFRQVVNNIRPLLKVLDFRCRSNTVLNQQIISAKQLLSSNKKLIIDGRLVAKKDKEFLKEESSGDPASQTMMSHRHELYLYKLIHKGILNGEVFVENSLEYRSFDDYLVDNTIWRQRKKHLQDVGLSWMVDSKNDHLNELETIFKNKLILVGKRINDGSNSYITRKNNVNKLLWSRAVIAKDDILTEKFFARFSRKTIINVIRKVHIETKFLDHFKPISMKYKSAEASLENKIACLLANGTFQGTHKFSAQSDQKYKVLKRIENDCFHDNALQVAIDTLTSNATRLSIFEDFKLSDGKIHSSADGQRIESKHGNPLVGRAAKYYAKKKGGIAYTLSSSYFAVRGKLIPPKSHESHHLFDIVHNNTSDLKSNTVATDTHGSNHFNHAILNTFGYQFMPRYARFKHKFLREFNVNIDDEVTLSHIKSINWKLIRAEWKNIVKIMLSLGMRTVQQSTLVKKLCSFRQHNSTMLALAEYNRVFKCLHLLDYADDKQIRQVIQESLNRGEQLQGLKRALVSLGGNQFRGTTPEEMTVWNSCADILANCIVYYNSMIMTSFKKYCIDTNNKNQLKHLRSISPASWEHILLNGFYDLADNDDYWNIETEIIDMKLAA